jgi:3-oxoacyl-[acyl-carrier protein] reductase
VLPAVCDVTNPADIKRFKKEVSDRFGACHILFTNAGGPPSGKLDEFTGEDFKKAIDLNLMSTIQLVYAFLPFMKSQKWGRVLASTSSNIRHLLPQFPLSNVSRIGIVAFIKTLAYEVAHLNITANVLAPGLFMTGPTKEFIEDRTKRERIPYGEALKKIRRTIPTRTIGNPEDFGALAAFLASEQASYITGETILMDGGQYGSVM